MENKRQEEAGKAGKGTLGVVLAAVMVSSFKDTGVVSSEQPQAVIDGV